ncbi:ARM repeat-containing protein [Multifurca ochricompacta]|uniref:non-specific serine/threonine protein kinase n=1 Tax=Multifurca ochricompacta TaxID=376703 RepID=A0AAD4M8V4_9AGAM|nr:ARM repeat-containing protein [Multifurca ochricompacta]
MGNTQSGYTLTRTAATLDSFISELGPEIVYEKSLGSSRFLKTVRCRHRNGLVVVKIYIKPDLGASLQKYQNRLKVEREALFDIPNVYSYQNFIDSDKAGYLIRQWVASNLYDRISTRPFLSTIEKKWIAFQLLNALRDVRSQKIAHGDVKAENILVTSWNWVYLTDFASHKPTYLPLDDPSDFAFYFDTSGRRSCYVAPERFFASGTRLDGLSSAGNADQENKDVRVTEAMDVFSAGCVIAELFREGAPLFTLSQLFKYREGELNMDGLLASVEDGGVRNLIKDMIALDPSARPTFDALLHNVRGTVFPEVFYSFLHGYVSSINELPTATSFAPQSTTGASPEILTPAVSTVSTATSTVKGGSVTPLLAADAKVPEAAVPRDADHKIEKIWADYESVEPYLVEDAGEDTVTDVRDVLPVELFIPNRDSRLLCIKPSKSLSATEDGPALIILALVCANVRNCNQPSSKLRALDVFLALSVHLTDEAKLDRLVPYIVDLLRDDAAVVRAAALRTLLQVLSLVNAIAPANAAIFPEYIIPNVHPLVQDPEVSVRSFYAQCLVPLADAAVRYLEMGQALKAHGTFKATADAVEYDEAQFEVPYDAALQDLQNSIQEHLVALLVDPSSVVKRAVLRDVSSICIFLGRQRTNDILLSHMITYLNDRDWLIRYAFFDAVVDVAACAGGRSLEEYILPLMIQALSDVEEIVVARVLAALTSLCELGLFQKMRIWELMSANLGFLYHPNAWIRQGATAFIASAANHLPSSDVWGILYPSLRHFLRFDVRNVDELSLLTALKPPLERQVFDAALQWAMKADKTHFWRGQRKVTKPESPHDSIATMRKAGTARIKTEEDEGQLAKLRQLGMTSTEEAKLISMRDYILKLANAISSYALRQKNDEESDFLKKTAHVELQKLKVVPQTVFLRTRVSDLTSRTPRLLPSARYYTSDNPRSPHTDTSRISRPSSIDYGFSGAPFEDLRRRLTALNGSGASLPSALPQRLSSISVSSPSQPVGLSMEDLPEVSDRPGSPTDSVLSGPNPPLNRGKQRFHVGGGDGQKAAPAIGSSKANATGHLEPTSKMRSEGSPERSGRTSPVSAAGTVQGQNWRRPPSLAPISTYDGHEAGINNLLEHLYLDSNQEYQHDFGPRVHEGPVRRRNTVRQSFTPRDGTARRPEATLIAQLSSHADAVTALAVSPDHLFFVSSSDDKTVKVWDTARLERNVTSKPRFSYTQRHAKIKAICMLEGVHCFASAADDGSLHIVRVHINQSGALPRYTKIHTIREHKTPRPGEYITCMAHFDSESASNLHPSHSGPITIMCLDRRRAWIVTGTASGVLTLWDIRFGLMIKTWKTASATTNGCSRIYQCVVHPSRGRGRWVIVAVETARTSAENVPSTLLEVWDVESMKLVETYETRITSRVPTALDEPQDRLGSATEPSAATAIATLVRARHNGMGPQGTRRTPPEAGMREVVLSGPFSDIRALVVGHEFGGHSTVHRSVGSSLNSEGNSTGGRGFMVSGSEDRKLRLWDLGKVERTTILSGAELESEKPSYSTAISSSGSTMSYMETWLLSAQTASQQNRPPQRMMLLNNNQHNLLRPHQDTITALACVDSPFRCGIISGDRAGGIKVWRVDGADYNRSD